MKTKFLTVFILCSIHILAQNNNATPVIDPLSFGVVLDDPATKNVIVKPDITFLEDAKGTLKLDIYQPPHLGANEKRPAIIFLNAIGENAGQRKVKSWGIYTSWPKLMAAQGYIGISMEADAGRIRESIQAVFDFINNNGIEYNIDKDKLGVYAASANVNQSAAYVLSQQAYPGIKAAVLYYGGVPEGPYRKDLPVFFVVSEGDVQRNGYTSLWNEVLKNNAPWTIKMGTGMPHAFDAYADNDDARRIVKETISFWKNYLDPVPAPSWKPSKARDALGLLRMDNEKALVISKSLAEENPKDAVTLSFYAATLAEAKHAIEAKAVYEKLLALEPNNLVALLSLANIAYGENKDEEGKAYIMAAEKTGLMKAGNYGGIGYNFLVQNRNELAAKYYEKAIALQPNGHDYYNLACAYAKSNEREKALNALAKSIAMGNTSKSQIDNDTDFDSIRSDERFKKLLEKLDTK